MAKKIFIILWILIVLGVITLFVYVNFNCENIIEDHDKIYVTADIGPDYNPPFEVQYCYNKLF